MQQTILDIIKGRGLSVFDIETITSGRTEQMFSAAVSTGNTQREIFFEMPAAMLKSTNYRSAQYLKRSDYFNQPKVAKWMSPEAGTALYDLVGKSVAEDRNLLVGHNIKFDIKQGFRGLSLGSKQNLAEAFGQKSAAYIRSDQPRNISALISKGHGKQAYSTYMSHIAGKVASGKTASIDTMTLTQMLMARATERGDVGVSFTGDHFTGTKLSFISNYFGWDPKLQHTGKFDVGVTEKYLNWLSEKALPQMMDPSGVPDEEVLGLLKHLKGVQESGWRKTSASGYVAQHALDYVDTGQVVREVGGKYKRVVGDVTGSQIFDIMGGKDYSALSVEETTYLWDAEVKQLRQLKTDQPGKWKSLAQQSMYEKSVAAEKSTLGFISEMSGTNWESPTRNIINKPTASQVTRGKKFFKYAGLGIAAYATYSIMFSGRKENFNTIEGLRHGGMAEQKRKELTDFGSGWNALRGLTRASETLAEMTSSKAFQTALKEATQVKLLGKGDFATVSKMSAKFRGKDFSFARKVGNIHPNEAQALEELGGSLAPNLYRSEMGGVAGTGPLSSFRKGTLDMEYFEGTTMKDTPWLTGKESIKKKINRKAIKEMSKSGWEHMDLGGGKNTMMINTKEGIKVGVIDFGLSAKTGQKFSGKDDAYNTIEGMFHGGISQKLRRKNTDFGSGYRGPVAPVHHPEISPEYNKAEDVYRYKAFRASRIGLPEEELYKWATQKDKEFSPYVQATSTAGTAMHMLRQAQQLKSGEITSAEDLTYSSNISGHIDVRGPKGIGDIKSVNNGIFQSIMKEGKLKPMHKAQVMFYLGSEGEERGYVEYVNRDKPWQSKTFNFGFNQHQYQALLRKADRVQARIEAEIATGEIMESSLPMTASIKTLQEDFLSKPSVAEEIANLPGYNTVFKEEMAYLSTMKRGMPKSGKGYERIKRKEHSTQGIGLQMFNDRIGHHIM